MKTLDEAIMYLMSDGKRRVMKDILFSLMYQSDMLESIGVIPHKSTVWYHVVKLCKEGKLTAKYYDDNNRVEYIYSKKQEIIDKYKNGANFHILNGMG